MKIKKENNFVFEIKYWIKSLFWSIFEYFIYGFFVGLGVIMAIKLFY